MLDIEFTPEHSALFSVIELLTEANDLTDWAPIKEAIHVAKVEAERQLGESLLRCARRSVETPKEEPA